MRLIAILAGLMLVGCGGDAGPTAGALKLNLVTPYGDDGGVLLTIAGGPIDSIESAGNRVYMSRGQADSLQIIIAGRLSNGVIARLHIPDTRQSSSYSATLLQAAARSSYLQRDAASYSISLAP